MADAVANLGNGLQEPFPFMKLPAELRLVVYELAMRSYLEDIDRTKFFQCGPPGIEMSLEAANKMREARKLEVAELERRTESQAAPYLGALALLHTSKMVYWESYHAMRDLVEPHRSARWYIMWEAFWPMLRVSFGENKHTADLLRYEHDEMSAIWSYLSMVNRSFRKLLIGGRRTTTPCLFAALCMEERSDQLEIRRRLVDSPDLPLGSAGTVRSRTLLNISLEYAARFRKDSRAVLERAHHSKPKSKSTSDGKSPMRMLLS